MNPQDNNQRQYQVKTGLMEVVVQATSVEDAVRIARDQLCLELPRLWDVIQSLPEERFVATVLDRKPHRPSNAPQPAPESSEPQSSARDETVNTDPQQEAA